MATVQPDDELYAIRWVLSHSKGEYELDRYDENGEFVKHLKKHCDACKKFEGEYASYKQMLEKTEQAVPGYFPGYAEDFEEYDSTPSDYKGLACGGSCTCHLELFINGEWQLV